MPKLRFGALEVLNAHIHLPTPTCALVALPTATTAPTRMHIRTYVHNIHACSHTHIYIHTNIENRPLCTHTHIRTCTPTHLHTYIHPSIHPFIHPSLHTYIPTHIHTYIHTYLDGRLAEIQPFVSLAGRLYRPVEQALVEHRHTLANTCRHPDTEMTSHFTQDLKDKIQKT